MKKLKFLFWWFFCQISSDIFVPKLISGNKGWKSVIFNPPPKSIFFYSDNDKQTIYRMYITFNIASWYALVSSINYFQFSRFERLYNWNGVLIILRVHTKRGGIGALTLLPTVYPPPAKSAHFQDLHNSPLPAKNSRVINKHTINIHNAQYLVSYRPLDQNKA